MQNYLCKSIFCVMIAWSFKPFFELKRKNNSPDKIIELLDFCSEAPQ